jgi:hypothetical protein
VRTERPVHRDKKGEMIKKKGTNRRMEQREIKTGKSKKNLKYKDSKEVRFSSFSFLTCKHFILLHLINHNTRT